MTLEEVYRRLVLLEGALQMQTKSSSLQEGFLKHKTEGDFEEITLFADESLLAEAWSGSAEDEAWNDL